MDVKDIELGENDALLSNKNGVTIFFKEKIDEIDICNIVGEWYLILVIPDGRKMYVDEEAFSKSKPVNNEASKLADVSIAGNVILTN
tara:strand:+ start:128 stop:388 length:261 start_codon:yes stop_codon:yes gene_type:complete